MQLLIDIPEDSYKAICEGCTLTPDVENAVRGIMDGIPFQEICDKENSEIKNNIKELSKRVDILEKQMKEDWIEERTYLECPNCHDIWHYERNQTERFKFCPTCGKMVK